MPSSLPGPALLSSALASFTGRLSLKGGKIAASSSDSHPANSASPVERQFPFPNDSSKSPRLQASEHRILCLSLNSVTVAQLGHIQPLGLGCGVARLELRKLRVRKEWFPKGNSRCAVYYPKEAIGARQAKPTAVHSIHPFRTTDRIFPKAEFDKMRDRLV